MQKTGANLGRKKKILSYPLLFCCFPSLLSGCGWFGKGGNNGGGDFCGKKRDGGIFGDNCFFSLCCPVGFLVKNNGILFRDLGWGLVSKKKKPAFWEG